MSWSQEGSQKLYNFEYAFSSNSLKGSNSAIVEASQNLPSPHIQLTARLSQTWLNQWTIFLILIIVRLVFAAQRIKQDMSSGLADLTVACNELEVASSTAVSMPHYLAQGTNSLIKLSVDEVVSGLSQVTIDLLTAVEEIVLFIVNTFKSTYLCLLEFAISGSLDTVVSAVEDVGDYVNSTLADISSDIEGGISDANAVLNKIATVVEEAASFLGETITIPTINITAVSELTDLHLPTSFDTDLETLKDALNLDAVQNATDDVIKLPFEMLKTLVSDKLGNYSFNQSLLNVPATEQLTFCSDSGLDQTFEAIEHAVFATYYILLAVLVAMAVLVIVPYAWMEWWKWRSLKLRSSAVFSGLRKARTTDDLDLVQIKASPVYSLLGFKVASHFRDRKSQNLARWYIAYITHRPAMLVLLIAIAGLISCALQGIMLSTLERATPSLAQDVTDVSELVYTKLLNASAVWANQTNTQINATQYELNQDLFGWVDTSTTAVNDTLNTFTDTLVETLNSTFGGTILYEPILEVLDCIILLKLQGIESGLTWVYDEARITLPSVPLNVFAMNQSESSTLFGDNPSSTTEEVEDAIETLIDLWRTSIRQEALVAGSLMLAWLLIALGGLIRVLIDSRRGVRPPVAFSSCFMKDVKACISRPKQDLSRNFNDEIRMTESFHTSKEESFGLEKT